MTAEAWTIIGASIAIAGILVGLVAWLRSDMKDRFARLENGQSRLEERQNLRGRNVPASLNQPYRERYELAELASPGRARPGLFQRRSPTMRNQS